MGKMLHNIKIKDKDSGTPEKINKALIVYPELRCERK